MNDHERRAWRVLAEMGCEIEMMGKPALDLRKARPRSEKQRSQFIGAVINVAGRSGNVRRHVDRLGNPVFVVTDPA